MNKCDFCYEPLLTLGSVYGACMYPCDDRVEGAECIPFYKTQAVLPSQTHSLNVRIVDSPSQTFPDTDALISFNPEIAVGVLTADCVPLLLYAHDIGGIAAVHAGWRGTLGGIVENTIDMLIAHGASPENIYAAIAPSIRVDNYEVDRNLADKFTDAGFGDFVVFPDGEAGKPHIDLCGINRERMLRRGIKIEKIIVHPGCTFGSEPAAGMHYPSHRHSKGASVRMLTFIRMGGQ